jgi:hypothetical protein
MPKIIVKMHSICYFAGMTSSKIEFLWCNPKNWKGYFFYFCKEDPRIIVPKRLRGLGWTLNFARPLAIPVFGAICLFLYAPFYALDSFVANYQGYDWMLVAFMLVLLCVFCTLMASPYRYEKRRGGQG